ncbi:MAG: ATP-binding cassette domain-containing protein [Pseudomonadota bacterium]
MKLSVADLTKSYHQNQVVNLGEAVFGAHGLEGLIGPNGAGKSTLMGLLTRRIAPTTGRIACEIDGKTHPLMPLRAFEVARLGLVKTNQRIQGFESLSIRDQLRLAATPPGAETLPGVFDKAQHDDQTEAEIDSYLARFSFQDPQGFARSSGEKKLLDILRCLIFKPRMLLMDEPTAGLPEDVTGQVMTLISEKVAAGALTVILVEHDLDLIWSHCAYVHFLSEGEILFEGAPEAVKANRVVAEKYMGV